jgi:hypothetical protein
MNNKLKISTDEIKEIIKILKILNIFIKLDCEIDQNMTIDKK